MGAGASRVLPRQSPKCLRDMESRKKLFMGAICGSPLLVMDALDHGENPNKPARDTRMTALHYAARYGNEKCIELLLKSGAKLNVPQRYGWRPIHEAAMNGHTECVRMLLRYGSHANAKTGKTIRNMTPLHYAARMGHLDCVKVLVEMGARVDHTNELYETPFHVAAMREQVPVMEYLLDQGANINARTLSNMDATYFSVMIGSLQAVRMLMERGIDLEAVYRDGWRLIHVASDNGRVKVLVTLLDAGVDIESKTYERRLTAVHVAARQGQVGCLRVLRYYGADMHVLCTRGQTALQNAVKRKHAESARFLIDAGVDVNVVSDYTKETALHMCMLHKDVTLLKMLLVAGADPTYKDHWEKTALDLAWDKESRKLVLASFHNK